MKTFTVIIAILTFGMCQAQPIASFTLDTNNLCEGQWPAPSGGTFTPTNTSDTSSAVGPISYLWQMLSGTPSSSSNKNPGPIQFNVGKHSIKLTVFSSNGVSTYTDSVEVKAIPLAYLSLDTNSNNPFCDGDSAVLETAHTNTNFYSLSYLWNTGDSSKYIDINNFSYSTITCYTSGAYYYTATDSNGCSAISNTLNIVVNPLPIPVISPYLTSYLVSSISSGNQWYLDSVLMVGETGQQLFTPVVNGTYNVEVTDANGCIGWSQDYVVNGVGISEYQSPSDIFTYVNGRLTVLKGTWKLYDIAGGQVLNGSVGTYTIPVGIYILHTEIGASKIAHID